MSYNHHRRKACRYFSCILFFFCSTPWQAGKALLPDHSTQESSWNQESQQSSATIVPQLSVVADMTGVGRAKSETRRCNRNCHACRHPKVLLEH